VQTTLIANNNSVAIFASELYRPSDRRLSAKLVPTFVDRGWSAQRSPAAVFSVF
jgi:hypothetical protein